MTPATQTKAFDNQCVCLEDFSETPEQSTIRLKCGHIWHAECFNKWLKTCPEELQQQRRFCFLRCQTNHSYWEHIRLSTAVGSVLGLTLMCTIATKVKTYQCLEWRDHDSRIAHLASSTFCTKQEETYDWQAKASLVCSVGGLLAGFAWGNLSYLHERLIGH